MLNKLIKEKGLTQKQFADAIGVSQQLISKWINHKCEPQIEMLYKIADYLYVDITTIIDCFRKQVAV